MHAAVTVAAATKHSYASSLDHCLLIVDMRMLSKTALTGVTGASMATAMLSNVHG